MLRHSLLAVMRMAILLALVPVSTAAQEPSWQDLVQQSQEEYRKGNYSSAEELLKTALKQAKEFGRQDGRYGTSLRFLAEFYVAQDRYAEAEPLYREFLQILEDSVGPNNILASVPVGGLAKVLTMTGKFEEAEVFYKRAINILEKDRGRIPDQFSPTRMGANSSLAAALENYAGHLRKTRASTQAARLEARAQSLRAENTRYLRQIEDPWKSVLEDLKILSEQQAPTEKLKQGLRDQVKQCKKQGIFLASLYEEQGNKQKAAEIIRSLQELIPGDPELAEIMKSLEVPARKP